MQNNSSNTWFKIYRKIIQSSVFKDAELLKFWIWILASTAYTEHERIIDKKLIKLEKGQLIIMNDDAEKDSEYIEALIKNKMIKKAKRKDFIILTVTNWVLYQHENNISQTKDNQQINNRNTANEHNNTWFKLDRKIIESPVFDNAELLRFWLWILSRANHKESKKMIGLTTVTLQKGQLIFGRKSASEALEISENKVYRFLLTLETENMITKKSTNKYTVINVENWEFYQEITLNINNKQTTNKQLSDNEQTTSRHIQESKEGKEGKEGKELVYSQIENLRKRYSPEQLKIIDDYFDVLKYTRRSGKIANSVILKIYKSWEKHHVSKVIYALYIYVNDPKHHDKQENYVLGIMNKATAKEIESFKNKTLKNNQSSFSSTDNSVDIQKERTRKEIEERKKLINERIESNVN